MTLIWRSETFTWRNIEEKEAEARCKVLSCAQDIVYGVSGGRKWTPKYIGLGSTLHHVT